MVPLEARGRGGGFFLAAWAMAATALGVPAWRGQPLVGPALGMASLLLAAAAACAALGAWRRGRRLALEADALSLRACVSSRRWPLASLAALECRFGSGCDESNLPDAELVLRDASGAELGRVSLDGWDVPALRTLLRALAERRNLALPAELARHLDEAEQAARWL